jgi:hypothetical protein
MKTAMKARSEFELGALRMLFAALKNKQIELMKQEALTDDEALMVVATEVKKRKDSALAYRDGKRPDLAEKEEREIALYAQYLPAQLSEDDIRKAIKAKADELGLSGQAAFGQLMKAAMAGLKGQADGAAVSRIVKEILG